MKNKGLIGFKVRERSGKTAENGEILGRSAGSTLPDKACECPTRQFALEMAARYGEDGRKALTALSAPCPCAELRVKYTEAGGLIMDLERRLESQQRGCADEIAALVQQRDSLRARVETLETDLAEAKLMLGAISECTNGNEWVEWNQRADELRAAALKEGK